MKKFLGKIEELENNLPKSFVIDQDTRIALFHLRDNFYAIDDRCSHDEASLADGEVDGNEVSCPLHGARFNIISGENLTFPAVKPVKSYPVSIEDGMVYIELES